MIKAEFITYTLHFKFLAGTSRGTLKNKKSWFLKIWDDSDPEIIGFGEAGPLPGLSIDYNERLIEQTLQKIVSKIGKFDLTSNPYSVLKRMGVDPGSVPSITMALETAWIDLSNSGKREIFKNNFYKGQKEIPINGLVWMGDKDFMIQQIDQKINNGFDCIKIKVGSLDFGTELEVLDYLRKSSEKLEIRLDANGAFNERDVFKKLEQLSKFNIHSIEQPVKQENLQLMQSVIRNSPIKIALDEELIGISDTERKEELLGLLNPDYIILKPSLVGGFSSTSEWIQIAESYEIGWWITSALESNIGLNAICQFTAEYKTDMYQGLGTGSLYQNNIPSPLKIKEQKILYDLSLDWDISMMA